MGQIYHELGLSISCVSHRSAFMYDPEHKELDKERDEKGGFKVIDEFLRPISRREAYKADITYGTNHEFGFDYLRDNMAMSTEMKVQRTLSFAIIDEIDSVLIDEARTPLIISAPDTESSKLYSEFSRIIPQLKEEEHYELHEKEKAVTLTEPGVEKIEKIIGVENVYQDKGTRYLHYLEQSLRAEVIFKKDRDYVVKNGEITIVDEFTGRLMPGRRWSGGLHQAVEAKENLNVQPESLTLASISIQNYFRMYDKLSGMTGTAATSGEEFEKVYKLDVVVIPTNKPIARQDLSDLIYKTQKEKLQAITNKVKEAHEKGQPVLIGTRSIEKNELLSALLQREGIQHEVLNAKQHEREGEIIAQAGKRGAVTVATNMAGRGVDIVLGGNPSVKPEEIKELGGLLVIGTERHDARRIDNQLRGRSGRQGDPGATQFYLSLDDDLMRIFGGDRIKTMMDRMKLPDGQEIKAGIINKTVESAQSKIEGMNFDVRKHLLEYDDVQNIQRTSFYKKRNEIVDADKDRLREIVLEMFKNQQVNEKTFLDKEIELGSRFVDALRFVALKMFDTSWISHLQELDYLKDRVRLRAYGQLDPLVEYKNEGYKMFKELLLNIEDTIVKGMQHVRIEEKPTNITKEVVSDNHVGRNDPCPCGSGKKYKKCCGK